MGLLARVQNVRTRQKRDLDFLERCFQKLLVNFTWWVNRKDVHGKHIFAGGFLGLDNIGLFDRSQPLPCGHSLAQADGTAWMAFYCGSMLSMALELAQTRPAYDNIASKFFEHFIQIVDAMNSIGNDGLWDETDGFTTTNCSLKTTAPLRCAPARWSGSFRFWRWKFSISVSLTDFQGLSPGWSGS